MGHSQRRRLVCVRLSREPNTGPARPISHHGSQTRRRVDGCEDPNIKCRNFAPEAPEAQRSSRNELKYQAAPKKQRSNRSRDDAPGWRRRWRKRAKMMSKLLHHTLHPTLSHLPPHSHLPHTYTTSHRITPHRITPHHHTAPHRTTPTPMPHNVESE